MRDSNYVRQFPLSTPYFTVKNDGSGLNTAPKFTAWFAGLGADEDQGMVFIDHGHPANGFVVKTGFNVPAMVLVPYNYISRMQAAGGSLIVAGPLTAAYTLPTPAANQNIFVFKNGTLQASTPAQIPASTSDMWAIVLTNDVFTAGTPPAPYSATLAATPLTGTAGTTVVTFTLTETNKPGGATASYAWDFGDGTSVTTTTVPTTTHTYAAAGSYTGKATPTINGTAETQVTAAATVVIS